jgi:DNA-binding MarR family transcriptional regulator
VGDVTDTLAADLLEAVGQLRRQTRRVAGRPKLTSTLSGPQTELVRHVRRHPATSVAAAAADLGVAPNTVSTLVTQLVEAGVLVREQDDGDRRIYRLRLTPRAQRSVDRWRDHREAVLDAALATLTVAQRSALARAVPALSALAAAVREVS